MSRATPRNTAQPGGPEPCANVSVPLSGLAVGVTGNSLGTAPVSVGLGEALGEGDALGLGDGLGEGEGDGLGVGQGLGAAGVGVGEGAKTTISPCMAE
jgi:hypothetical protein